MPDGLRLALTLLTVARVRGPRQLDRRTAGRAMELAPLVGLGLGAVAGGVLVLARLLTASDLLAAALAVAALALLTRGLHLDGLADLVDGLGSYRDPAGARAVMKSPDLGPLGAAAVMLVLLVQVSALAACEQHGRGLGALLLAVSTGRVAVTAACRDTAPATVEGLGALVARTVRPGLPTAWAATLAAGFAGYAWETGTLPDGAGVLVAVPLALLLARLLRAHAVRRTGGLTGDLLGALCESAGTVCLVVLAGS